METIMSFALQPRLGLRARMLASLASIAALLVGCGGTVVYGEDGGRGTGDGGGSGDGGGGAKSSAQQSGNGQQSSNALAGTAGPGGVGGADSGPNLSKSSAGVGAGEGCFYLEEGTTHCYSHRTCDGGVQETECELGGGPKPCWCFLDGAFVGTCEEPDSWCGSQAVCCNAFY
jgi:hypothetical protein